MNARLLLIPLLLVVFTASALAQAAGVVTGRVVSSSGEAVPGAAVEVLGSSPRIGSYARTDGSYRIRAIRPGSYRLRITAEGFTTDTVSVTVPAGELTIGLTVEPDPAAVSRTSRSRGLFGGGLAMDREMLVSAPVAADGSGAAEGFAATESFALDAGAAPPTASPSPTLAKRGAVGADAATATGATAEEVGRDERIEPVKPEQPERPGQLTAGEWCDLHEWTYWLDLAKSEEYGRHLPYWGFDPSSRISVIAVDGERLVADAEVTLTDGQSGTIWRARTDNRGRAELFVGVAGKPAGTYRIEVRSGEAKAFVNNIPAGATTPVIAKLRDAAPSPTGLDVMFVIDATGSMGDEITYIKSELESVIDRVRENHSDRIAIRMAASFYRDQGDEYVVRPIGFTESTFDAIGFIRENHAGGGGDFPEAVEEALDDAIEKHDWSPSARARLMFMVLDAPPHYDEGRIRQIQALAKRAAEKGIRIIPVASSGIDKETEFLLRLMAIYSGGTYTFLTDDSGIGNAHLKPSIGKYDIEYLDDLMVRLIGRWLDDVTLSDEVRAALK